MTYSCVVLYKMFTLLQIKYTYIHIYDLENDCFYQDITWNRFEIWGEQSSSVHEKTSDTGH